MSKRNVRIRLSGLEVACRSGATIVVPWHLVGQNQRGINPVEARRIWPDLQLVAAFSQTQARVARRLRERATRNRLREKRIELHWLAPHVRYDAFMYASVAFMIASPLAPLLFSDRGHSPAIEAAIRSQMSPGVWIAVGLLTLLIAVPFAICIARLARLAIQRRRNPRPVAFRATSRGLTVCTDDGHETTYDWDQLVRCSNGVFEFKDGREFNVAFGETGPPELNILSRVLDPRRDRALRNDHELLAELRAMLPTAFRAWLFFGVIAAAAVIAIEPDPGRIPRMIAVALLAPLIIGVQLAVLLCASVLPLRLEKRARHRRRRRHRQIAGSRGVRSDPAYPA